MKTRITVLSLALFLLAQAETLNPALWSGMKYRMIGPERGGRVTAVTGVPSQPFTFYMGSTGGGVWKTIDAGHSWVNISDGFFSVASTGAIDVALTDPNVIYAGTGSSKIRSNVSVGRGMYKSTDAGKTWSFIGLRDAGQIATIRIHPANPDIVYVAVTGNAFVPSADRGVYRTMDGGKTWKKVLFISETLGAADLELQPGNPKVLFACMWHGQRKPWTIISGALEGGIYKSTDGGETWNKLGGGLPHEIFGRSNVAISASKPGPHLRAHRGQTRIGPLPFGRRGCHVGADQRFRIADHSTVLLHHHRRGSQQFRSCLGWRRRLVQEYRWRQDVPHFADPAWRQP